MQTVQRFGILARDDESADHERGAQGQERVAQPPGVEEGREEAEPVPIMSTVPRRRSLGAPGSVLGTRNAPLRERAHACGDSGAQARPRSRG